jgi:hypothetical protein
MDHELYLFTLCITVLFHTEPSDDDQIDRLNRKYTVYGLVGLAILSGSRLITYNISSLISCWNRANFPSAYINYTNYICFIASSYTLKENELISSSIDDRLLKLLIHSLKLKEK